MTYLEKLEKRFEKDFFATKAAKIKLVNAEPECPESENSCEARKLLIASTTLRTFLLGEKSPIYKIL
jgi:hypothetical protein